MMEPFERIDIQELPLSVPAFRRKVEDFLGRNGLRLEEVDLYLAVQDPDGSILAGGGLYRDIIKCIAVSEEARSLGLSTPLISRLISVAADRGHTNVKVFTKPENRAIFESLGFRVLASAPKAILMENGRGLEEYCAYLRSHRSEGVIIMNANPFTLGHRFLLEQAAAQVEGLAVIPVKENLSRFPYSERLDMVRKGSECLADVLEGSDYQISAATFPTYFLKDLTDVSETQMRLDIDLFGRHIAPALGASVRFVGSEPTDPLTARYNGLMQELLPSFGVRVVEIPRLRDSKGTVSATRVRAALDAGRYSEAAASTPASTRPYLLADLAERALRLELDAPLKPGLVGPDSAGAHQDMDYTLMLKSIAAIRPFFPRIAQTGVATELRQLGLEAEKAMLAASGGVNTHRGAIFALGLVLSAAGRRMEVVDYEQNMQNCLVLLARTLSHNNLKDSELYSTPGFHGSEVTRQFGVKGAREMALEGYKDLFENWLPAYRSMEGDSRRVQKTLLLIMSGLDDTCIIHRVGYERAQLVKQESKSMLDSFNGQGLEDMCIRYASEGISPGGAADMLALTIFMDSLLN